MQKRVQVLTYHPGGPPRRAILRQDKYEIMDGFEYDWQQFAGTSSEKIMWRNDHRNNACCELYESLWEKVIIMGNKKSQLTKAELEDYKELTYLTEREIQCAFTRFKNLNPKLLNKDKKARISTSIIKRMPEFQNNPFAERICDIFSSQSDQSWSFEDFLDMVSVFSPSTPEDKKAEYAFNIYDFDGDGMLSEKDILILMTLLMGNNHMDRQEMEDVVDKVMGEADIDQDGHLSLSEFKHILMKCPDFGRSFTIRI